ncbi:cysteine desulfurase [Candidatus Saccharibacteria bacterium]|nr:cysteine desulfurase [Candidatus Saccharibacteria bacterium]
MIYLDHAAATPVSKKVLEKMTPYFSELFFNPSSPYLPAKTVREDFEHAKSVIANSIGAKGNDLVITSGATEANALAFTAVSSESRSGGAKILVLETEHASVLESVKRYPFELIKVDRTGLIDLSNLKNKLSENTELISVSLANNELGTIQPLAEIATILKEEKLRRLKNHNTTPLFLHSDASQGLSLLDINVARLGVDLLTLNAAKISGPKGVGALYISHEVRLKPFVNGGGQERGLRAGTENVAGVVGFAAAVEALKNHSASKRKKYMRLVENLKHELEGASIEPVFLGNKKSRLANFLPVSFPGLDAERLIYKLEERGVLVSTGAACAASKGEASHVLKAIGLSSEEIAGSLRISLGVLNTEENVEEAGRIIREVVDSEFERIKNDH